MGIFDFFRPREESKASATGTIIARPGEAKWTPRNYAHFADEAYRRNVIAYQSIERVADAVSSVELEVWRNDTQLTEHPLIDLLKRPNPMQSGAELMRAKIGFYLIAGNSYDERIVLVGEPRELYTLRPDRMQIVAGNSGIPQQYVYKVGGNAVTWDVDPITGESDVLHSKTFNPLDDWYGQSPVEAGAYGVDQHNESMTWMQSLLQNSATPSGALINEDKKLSEEQFNRLKAQVDEQYVGARNAGRPMLLEGGLTWQSMAFSPSDMSIIETKYSSARDVALAFGVPPMLLGIPGDNTYANYAEARLAFWEDTVLPLLAVVLNGWNNWLAEPMGVEIRPNPDSIPAIVGKRQQTWEMANASNDLTINERRALKGYEPIEGGDVILVPSGMINITDAAAPLDLGLPDDLDGADDKALRVIAGYAAKAS